MKVTLISPYLDAMALGLRGLSSFLKEQGVECEMIFLPDYKSLLRDEPDFVKRFPDSLLDDVVHACAESDLVGISLMSNYFDRGLYLTRAIKSALKVPVVWGGIHPTLAPEASLDYCDIVCVGEGELPMLNLARAMERKQEIRSIRGLWFKDDGKVIMNEPEPLILDLDALPFQDFDFKDHYSVDEAGEHLSLIHI